MQMNFQSEDIFPALSQVVEVVVETVAALGDKLASEWLPDIQHSTRACIVHDRVMAELERRFEDHPDVRVHQSNGLTFVTIRDVRFRVHCTKDPAGRISINHTVQTQQWNSGMRPVPGLPDPNEHYHIVYVPDDTWTGVRKLLVGSYLGPNPVSVREYDVSALSMPVDTGFESVEDLRIPKLKLKDDQIQQPLEGLTDEETA